jgi:aldehyde:ferredoxin oxidoreductase
MDPFSIEFKAELVKNQQDLFCLVNCTGLCLFATFALNLKQITPFLHAATGLESFSSSEGILRIGERVNNLVRRFNVREGATKKHDSLPRRFSKEPLKEGVCEGRAVDLEQLLKEYYFVRGWDARGIPTKDKLKELAIDGD